MFDVIDYRSYKTELWLFYFLCTDPEAIVLWQDLKNLMNGIMYIFMSTKNIYRLIIFVHHSSDLG